MCIIYFTMTWSTYCIMYLTDKGLSQKNGVMCLRLHREQVRELWLELNFLWLHCVSSSSLSYTKLKRKKKESWIIFYINNVTRGCIIHGGKRRKTHLVQLDSGTCQLVGLTRDWNGRVGWAYTVEAFQCKSENFLKLILWIALINLLFASLTSPFLSEAFPLLFTSGKNYHNQPNLSTEQHRKLTYLT